MLERLLEKEGDTGKVRRRKRHTGSAHNHAAHEDVNDIGNSSSDEDLDD